MTAWSQVKWTQARQVAEQMDLDESLLDDPDADPESGYRKLLERDEMSMAVGFLGHALPRLEAVAWAAHLLHEWSRSVEPSLVEQQALDSVQRWVEEPTEEYRRAAFAAGEKAGPRSPERLLAQAAFMSGGSISEPDLPAVQPPQHVCGRLVSGAVLLAAYRTADPKLALSAACGAGEKVAAKGLRGLTGE